jgi:hypothetical protein
MEATFEVDKVARTVKVKAASPRTGFLAFGPSPLSRMIGSRVVVARIDPETGEPSVTRMQLFDKDTSSVIDVDSESFQSLNFDGEGNSAAVDGPFATDIGMRTEGGRQWLSFTIPLDFGGVFKLSADGATNVAWSVGASHALQQHARQGVCALNFATGECIEDTFLADRRRLHGILMAVAFGFCFPAGVLSARFVKEFHATRWFQMHRTLQVTGFVLAIVSFYFIVDMREQIDTPHFHPSQLHTICGLVFMTMLIGQVCGGMFRPHLGSQWRKIWHMFHFTNGRLIVIGGGLQYFLGLSLDETVSGRVNHKWNVIGGGVALGFCVLWWSLEVRRQRKNFDATKVVINGNEITFTVEQINELMHQQEECEGMEGDYETTEMLSTKSKYTTEKKVPCSNAVRDNTDSDYDKSYNRGFDDPYDTSEESCMGAVDDNTDEDDDAVDGACAESASLLPPPTANGSNGCTEGRNDGGGGSDGDGNGDAPAPSASAAASRWRRASMKMGAAKAFNGETGDRGGSVSQTQSANGSSEGGSGTPKTSAAASRWRRASMKLGAAKALGGGIGGNDGGSSSSSRNGSPKVASRHLSVFAGTNEIKINLKTLNERMHL